MTQSSNLLSSVAKAASYNMLLQFSLRITTFVLNGFILRYVSKDMLGIVNVRLTLLYSTILFLAKEAFDRACLSRTEKKNWRQVINLLWCTLPLAALCAAGLTYVWLYVLDNPSHSSSVGGYEIGVLFFAVSTIIEILAEPLFVVGQAFLFVKLKVIILGLSQGIKCIVTVLLVLAKPQWGILNFCLAQVLSSASYAMMYHIYFAYYLASKKKKDDDFPFRSIMDFYPGPVKNKPLIDGHLASLTWSFFKQSFLKQILTEGEKYVMTFFDVLSYGDQGVYDVINNLGSMAARFVFLPIEENSYLFFSHLLSRGVQAEQQNQVTFSYRGLLQIFKIRGAFCYIFSAGMKDSLKLCARVLGVVLKTVTIIGAIILAFGMSNSYLALHLYGGELLSSGSGPMLLRWYCLYVLIIAINGTTEAFVFAAMSKDEVDKYNKKMLLFSGLFLFSSWLFTTMIGSVGFIPANCLNMLARIIHSVYFIIRYLASTEYRPLYDIVPSLPVIISLGISLIITSISEHVFCSSASVKSQMVHIFITALCLFSVIVIVYRSEQKLVSLVKEQISKSRSEKLS